MKPLPLADAPNVTDSDRLAGLVEVFDPAMCCPTGICSPGVDPALLVLARDLRWLESKGVKVERFGLAQQPGAFAENRQVAGLLQSEGDAALPATLVNGALLLHGRYPTRAELLASFGHAQPAAPQERAGCCGPGSACC